MTEATIRVCARCCLDLPRSASMGEVEARASALHDHAVRVLGGVETESAREDLRRMKLWPTDLIARARGNNPKCFDFGWDRLPRGSGTWKARRR